MFLIGKYYTVKMILREIEVLLWFIIGRQTLNNIIYKNNTGLMANSKETERVLRQGRNGKQDKKMRY